MGTKRTQSSGKVDSLGREIKVSGQEAQRASSEMDPSLAGGGMDDFSFDSDPNEMDFEDLLDNAFDFSASESDMVLDDAGAYPMRDAAPGTGLLHSRMTGLDSTAREALENYMAQNMPEDVDDLENALYDDEVSEDLMQGVDDEMMTHGEDSIGYLYAAPDPVGDMVAYGEDMGLTSSEDEIEEALSDEIREEIESNVQEPINLGDLKEMSSDDYTYKWSPSDPMLGRDGETTGKMVDLYTELHNNAARVTLDELKVEAGVDENGNIDMDPDEVDSWITERFPENYENEVSEHLDTLNSRDSFRQAVDMGLDVKNISPGDSPLSSYAYSVASAHARQVAREYLSSAIYRITSGEAE